MIHSYMENWNLNLALLWQRLLCYVFIRWSPSSRPPCYLLLHNGQPHRLASAGGVRFYPANLAGAEYHERRIPVRNFPLGIANSSSWNRLSRRHRRSSTGPVCRFCSCHHRIDRPSRSGGTSAASSEKVVPGISSTAKSARTRRVLGPVSGNNKTGKTGKLKCEHCRRRRSQVFFSVDIVLTAVYLWGCFTAVSIV